MQKFQDLESLIALASEDARKFSEGNSAAGTRLRKKMQEVKVLAQQIRDNVTEVKHMK